MLSRADDPGPHTVPRRRNPIAEAQAGSHGGAIVTERHGLLFVHAAAVVPEAAFDHRCDREARADQLIT